MTDRHPWLDERDAWQRVADGTAPGDGDRQHARARVRQLNRLITTYGIEQ